VGGKGLLKHLTIRPELVSKGLGGTLIQFNKNTNTIENPADANPQIAVESNVPLCVAFGTAETRPTPAPMDYHQPRGPEWKRLDQLPSPLQGE